MVIIFVTGCVFAANSFKGYATHRVKIMLPSASQLNSEKKMPMTEIYCHVNMQYKKGQNIYNGYDDNKGTVVRMW